MRASASTPCCNARPTKWAAKAPPATDLIILTHDTVEGTMDRALAAMQALPTVLAPITRIRKEELA
jgi:homoserine dehydrogenase